MSLCWVILKPGDEVIMPTFTIISCALAIVGGGGSPLPVDSEPRAGCMDVGQVEAKITARTRAIMPVHIYGRPVDMDPLLALAKKTPSGDCRACGRSACRRVSFREKWWGSSLEGLRWDRRYQCF